MARAGVAGDQRRDQHFLVDDRVLDRLPTYAESFDRTHVLEIGAGTGALTDRLLAVADRVTAIERDRSLVAFLGEEFADAIGDGRLEVVAGDATEIELPDYTACVSNLPYGASSPILFRLLPRRRPSVLMVQREFGERMAADPGDDAYGRLSVTAQHYGDVEVVEVVPPEAFAPPPEVESAVVRTTPRETEYAVPGGAVPDEAVFLDVVRAVFTQRRKTLRNAVRNTTHISGISDTGAVLDALGEDLLGTRPDAMTPDDFAAVASVAQERGGIG